jgi:uncharacterized membrane protein YccC
MTFVFHNQQAAQWAAVVEVVVGTVVGIVVVVFVLEVVQVGQAEKVYKFFDLEKEMSMSIRGHTT